MSSTGLQYLLQVLEERNIGLGSDDIAWAFESAKTKDGIESWVREYLQPVSLLTTEEKLFAEKRGQHNFKDASPGQHIPDQSFEDAIGSLEASTAAIEKQCRLLEAQRQALRKIKQRTEAKEANGDSSAGKDGRIGRERSQLEYKSQEIVDSLQSKFKTALKQAESSSTSVQPTVQRVLEKDDRLLDGLEKILPHLSDDRASNTAGADEVERLSQALKHLTTSDIRARIDAAYMEGAHNHANHANGINGKQSREDQQLISLNAELDELCREIDGLSTMAVENRFRNAIMQATSAAKADAEVEKAAWAEYLSSALQFSTSRMEYLHEHLEDQRARSSATRAISAALEDVLAAAGGAEKQDEGQRKVGSPAKSNQKGLKPLRLVQANLSDAQDPTSQLLRQLDVRVSGELTAETLSQALADKKEALNSLQANAERGMSSHLAHSLATADEDVQALLSAVFAHSTYGNGHLESKDVREGIEGLEAQTQELSERMRGLDFESITKEAKKKRSEVLKGPAQD